MGVEKIGQRAFCVLWTLKGHKKLKLENEHENLAKGVFVTKYHTLTPLTGFKYTAAAL